MVGSNPNPFGHHSYPVGIDDRTFGHSAQSGHRAVHVGWISAFILQGSGVTQPTEHHHHWSGLYYPGCDHGHDLVQIKCPKNEYYL